MDIDSAGVESIPGPRVSAPASSLHVPVVSPVWRGAFGCVGFRAACSGWPDRARVASDASLRARMPADQTASRPGQTPLPLRWEPRLRDAGAGLLGTSIPPGWVPSLVRGHPCPHLLCTSQQSHLFGDGFSDGCARGLPVRGCLTAGVASDGSLRARMPADQSDSRLQSQPVWRSAPIDQSTGIGASG